ncbi:hypothetical protein AMTRI_Chr06g171260 [Amborella trichopoda]
MNFYVQENLQENNKMRRGDVTWQYDTKVNDKGRVRCKFCSKEIGGGIYRLKVHLVWVKGNITGCKEVPPEVKQQMLKLITEGKGKKVQRERDAEELNYRKMEIQEMYGRRDGASSSRQPQEHVVPSRGGCGPSLLRSTSSRLRRSFSSHPSSYCRPSTTQ